MMKYFKILYRPLVYLTSFTVSSRDIETKALKMTFALPNDAVHEVCTSLANSFRDIFLIGGDDNN